MNEVYNCTRCGKEFKDFRIDVQVQIRTDRLRKDGVWEFIPNLNTNSREVLCYDCFDKFTNTVGGEMNIPFQSPESVWQNPAPNVDSDDEIIYDESSR